MRPKLKGKVLFVFSDPGGAKPCLSLIEENNLFSAIVLSDRNYSFYNDFKTKVKILDKEFEQLIEFFNPDLIFTGTSYTSEIEKHFIKIAKRRNIPCYSFIDHWTNISKRFEDVNGIRTFPDKVWVIDNRAKQLAIGEGIDEIKIVISGNPYHNWLKNWRPKISREDFFKQLGLQDQKILIYAPDPLSNVNGIEKYGFDELTATSLLVDLFNAHQNELKEWRVLIKAHPNQNKTKLNKIIKGDNKFIMLPNEVETNETICYGDVIMGFFSSFLIEASIMNKTVVRFLEEPIENEPFTNLNIGNMVNKKSLISFLKTLNK